MDDIQDVLNWKTLLIVDSSEYNWIFLVDKFIDLEVEKYEDESAIVLNKLLVLKLLTDKSKAIEYEKILSKLQEKSHKKISKYYINKVDNLWLTREKKYIK